MPRHSHLFELTFSAFWKRSMFRPGKSFPQFFLPASLLALALLVASGCQRGPRQHPVKGKLTFDGAPIDYAEIYFAPRATSQNSGRTMVAGALQGAYSLAGHTVTAGEVALTIQIPLMGKYAPKDWTNLTPLESARLEVAKRQRYVKTLVVDKDEIDINITVADLEVR